MNSEKNKNIPQEIQEAIKAYEKEYSKISDKVKTHRAKYKGTIYEDCPPLLDDELKFFVKYADSEKEKERLKEKYGRCLTKWAIQVTWWKKQSNK